MRRMLSPGGRVCCDLRAADDFQRGRGDCADYVIGHAAKAAGCDGTLTFDRRLQESPLFQVIE